MINSNKVSGGSSGLPKQTEKQKGEKTQNAGVFESLSKKVSNHFRSVSMADHNKIQGLFQITEDTKDNVLITLGSVTEKDQEYDIKKDFLDKKIPVLNNIILCFALYF